MTADRIVEAPHQAVTAVTPGSSVSRDHPRGLVTFVPRLPLDDPLQMRQCGLCRRQMARYCLGSITLHWAPSAQIKGARLDLLVCEDCQDGLTALLRPDNHDAADAT